MAMPSPTWRDPSGVAIRDAIERNLDNAQRQLNQCASNQGIATNYRMVLGTTAGSASSQAFAQLVKQQLDGDGFKHYQPATIS